MVRKRKYPFVGVLLALIVATALLPGGSVAAQMSEDDPLSGFAPALLPDYVSDMDAHADAPRYTIDITLALDHEGATISGEQQVIYTNRSPHALDRIVFRLYPNLVSYGGAMVVARVLVDGAPAAPDLDETGTVLSVPLASPLAPGERVTLALNYEIRVRAGVARLYKQFSYLDNVLALPNAYPVLSVYEAGDGWWVVADHTQGDAVYSESAFFEVTLRAPEDLIVVASGTEVSVRTGEDGLLVHEYVAPRRVLALARAHHRREAFVAVEERAVARHVVEHAVEDDLHIARVRLGDQSVEVRTRAQHAIDRQKVRRVVAVIRARLEDRVEVECGHP